MMTENHQFAKLLSIFGPGRQIKKRLEAKWRKLYRLAYAWTNDPHLASDLVQETLTKALQNWKQLNDIQALDAWLYKILANCWRDFGRKRRETVDIEDVDLVWDSDPEHESYRIQLVNQVRAAIAQLGPEQRQIITLIDLEGCSYGQVADILDIPMGTVMSRLCRARKKLQTSLQDHMQPAESQSNNVVPFK